MSQKKAIACARVLGPRLARTPEGHPILLISPPFPDTSLQRAKREMAQTAARWVKTVPHEPHWELLALYERTDLGDKRKRDAKYAHIYIFENVAERQRRKELGIDDACLDHLAYHHCWYAKKIELTDVEVATQVLQAIDAGTLTATH